MKKKFFACAILLLCLAVGTQSTLAYFTTSDTARNVITSGTIDIDLKELALQPDGSLVPFVDVEGVMPGQTVSKIVSVVNTGEAHAYIRLKVTKAMELTGEGEADPSLLVLDLNTTEWTEQDGYYYYNQPLAPGAETEPLFTTVTFSVDADNIYQSCRIVITVDAQATQVANNGDSALEAAGWSEN